MRVCYCRKCGTANEVDENGQEYFCGACGLQNKIPSVRPAQEPVTAAQAPVQETQQEPTYNTQPTYTQPTYNTQPMYTQPQMQASYMTDGSATQTEAKPKKKKKGLIIAIIIIVVTLALAAAAYFFLPYRFAKCDDCGKIKWSTKWEIEDSNGDTEIKWLCPDCFDEGYQEK